MPRQRVCCKYGGLTSQDFSVSDSSHESISLQFGFGNCNEVTLPKLLSGNWRLVNDSISPRSYALSSFHNSKA